MKSIVMMAALLAMSFPAFAANEVNNKDELRERLGLKSYNVEGKVRDVKIAILDNGFTGYEAGKGLLPEATEKPTLTQIGESGTGHGLSMAQIIWSVTGKHAEGPKFYLLNTNGFSNLKASVDYAVQQKVDIILYAQVWPFGGNLDGTGFINEQVNRATREGIIWINAAGNNGSLVHNGYIKKQMNASTGLITVSGRDHVKLENKYDENELTITLSWTDFQADEGYDSSKDLDLFVYNEAGKLVASGELIQKGEAPPPGDPNSKLSSHARESVTIKSLDRGKYQVKVKVNSSNFEDKDRFRVLVKATKPVELNDKTRNGEIMPPADNPNAITVGDLGEGSAIGPTFDGRTKPDVKVADSTIEFTNGNTTNGTSNAAAMLTGAVASMVALEPRIRLAGIRKYVATLTGGGGLQVGDSAHLHQWIKDLMPEGAQVMRAKRGYFVILTQEDPLSYEKLKTAGAYRKAPDDFILANPLEKRFARHPRNNEFGVSAPWVEFRYIGMTGGGIWKAPATSELSKWIH